MKKIISIITIIAFSNNIFSQVIIGDAVGTASSDKKASVLLEFANTGDKGIILPYVTSIPATITPGTILLDATAPTNARVKYYNGSWVDLSGDASIVTTVGDALNTSTVMTTVLSGQTTETETGKSVIGSTGSTADGVLVLESESKAMVLPIVESTDDILNPSPGMLVYLNKSDAKRLAVFNGSRWTYWKP